MQLSKKKVEETCRWWSRRGIQMCKVTKIPIM